MNRPLPERTFFYLFFAVVLLYCLLYAPYGINETDGGFLTGLGWQVLCGKTLYQNILYVRPPVPVWLRALELTLLPESWSILGERWIFYFKIGAYSWLAADLLAKGYYRWVLASFGFIVSVHNYPACAWHTVDGILFSVLAWWLYAARSTRPLIFAALAGVSFCAALLCKQSFFPLAVIFPVLMLVWNHPRKGARIFVFSASAFFCTALFFSYLYQKDILRSYLQMTGAAASGGQALQHGFLDYLRIKPVLALLSLPLLAPVVWWFLKRKNTDTAFSTWNLWTSLLLGGYVFETWNRGEFTAPFSQARLMFLLAMAYAGWLVFDWFRTHKSTSVFKKGLPDGVVFLLCLLAISWTASVSWGYNLPIFFATPWIFAALEIGRTLSEAWQSRPPAKGWYLAQILLLLAVARFNYEFVYRDGLRSDMTEHLGAVFPALQGIYSTPETAALYRDLRNLTQRYGQNFVVLPAFPQAHFLAGGCSPLPLDWVVKRETNGDNRLIMSNLTDKKPVLFIQKSFLDKIPSDPELELIKQLMDSGKRLEETSCFQVIRYE